MTRNQLKNAIQKYNGATLGQVLVEKRDIHKWKDTIRTSDNLEYIRNILLDSDSPLILKKCQSNSKMISYSPNSLSHLS